MLKNIKFMEIRITCGTTEPNNPIKHAMTLNEFQKKYRDPKLVEEIELICKKNDEILARSQRLLEELQQIEDEEKAIND